jgi:hypothetical protein
MKQNRRTKAVSKGGIKKDQVLAYRGFDLCNLPYTQDDIFAEPTQRRLQQTSNKYVPFLTFNNEVLDSLYSISQNSPTVGGIIAQKTAFTIAGGFVAVPASNNNPLPSVTSNTAPAAEADLLALNNYLKSVNPQDQSAIDVVEDIALNLWTFGNCFLEVFIVAGKLNIRVVSTYLCRPKKAGEGKLYPEFIGVSEYWQDNYIEGVAVTEFPIYPNFAEIDGAQRSILHLKFDSPNFYYWGRPDWLAGKIWGELEYRLAKYNQAKFENGFTPSAIISLFGMTNSEEAKAVVKSMQSCFTSTGNNSKMFIQALRDETYKADVQVLNNQNEGEFLALAQLAFNKIVTANRWSVALAGQSTGGQLGDNQQIRTQFDIVYSTVIRPVQKKITRALNSIFNLANKEGISTFKAMDSISIDLSKAYPVSFAGDIKPEEVLTTNEQREELGKPILEEEDLALEELKAALKAAVLPEEKKALINAFINK